ncbi:hypothetical protein J8273_2690 [Carpediemonas membranifera]|uniref:Uncharacterized protein n=1 Tax=Carpediemonas membranifera TaxID=201153 RepID=A0A8J6B4Y8_9EUKA|nr:hypothetical protein J8273_2690 [Carpediemonas membranifera]|eukprot:KAG9395778.1 hypothetical protein J8273_2690 [Carpediemonas membranifera]
MSSQAGTQPTEDATQQDNNDTSIVSQSGEAVEGNEVLTGFHQDLQALEEQANDLIQNFLQQVQDVVAEMANAVVQSRNEATNARFIGQLGELFAANANVEAEIAHIRGLASNFSSVIAQPQ